jgi:PadR family transcriptional regulator, regulatory protein AphA
MSGAWTRCASGSRSPWPTSPTGTLQSAESFLRKYISHFENQRRQALDEMNRIETGGNPTLVRRLENMPVKDRARITAFKRFSYEGRVLHAEAEIAWAKRGLELLEELRQA